MDPQGVEIGYLTFVKAGNPAIIFLDEGVISQIS
jgi:hypothetical protein